MIGRNDVIIRLVLKKEYFNIPYRLGMRWFSTIGLSMNSCSSEIPKVIAM